ncbi:twin-arginine translocase subunit TatB [Acetobacter lambici]|uniref:Sec-independent protein translocase protein TatB n=1 Tax=Acetobacter lambici TaxID=1332824 RepID=A0ABT1EZX1_9PROT|nr:Sec-independent protein translocase protein TatB [Acetobacter lambici]MCP1243219.1 Sec-independent protein translocase protein TatB [Acetobacter lambici]MCP1258505.1 Sec-independent protein translocase protein TatB [Acetobacter lambici]NHO57207.1 twin-arginine translocase subunit TatB [Acetobacter lambici]
MFDFAWSEFALIGAVALIVIGPKDLPVAIRGLAKGIKKARALASEFQSHLDEVVREADLSEVSEHVRDLKNLNVRGRIMKALDGDGSLSKAVSAPPVAERFVPSGPRALDAMPRSSSPAPTTPDYAAGHMGSTSYGSAPAWQDDTLDRQVESAPPELPPVIVRRILREQDRLHPPAIVPPVRLMHAGHRVAPGVIPAPGGVVGNGGNGMPPATQPLSPVPADRVEPEVEQSTPAPAQTDPASAPALPEGADNAAQPGTTTHGTGSTAADQQA